MLQLPTIVMHLLLECSMFADLSMKQELCFEQKSGGSDYRSSVHNSFWRLIKGTVDCLPQFSTLIKCFQMKTIRAESSIIKHSNSLQLVHVCAPDYRFFFVLFFCFVLFFLAAQHLNKIFSPQISLNPVKTDYNPVYWICFSLLFLSHVHMH